MRFVVLGAMGQLGRDLCPRLAGDVIPLTRADADLAEPAKIRAILAQHRPDVVVNCAAYNFVDKAESEPEAAFATNAWAVRHLATICRDVDYTLVHFSTDYVFGLDETRRIPYSETDAAGPVSVYGLSKLAGEYLVRSICPRHFIIRTCGLYGVWGSGGKGGNFVEAMLKRAAQGKPIPVVKDQVCTPSYTVDIAAATAALIQTQKFGLYHLINSGSCSWHDFARTIFQVSGLTVQLSPITSEEFGAAARRPSYSVLGMNAYDGLRLPPLRPWQEAVKTYLEEKKSKSC